MICSGFIVISLVVAFINGNPSSGPIGQGVQQSTTPLMDNKWEQVRNFMKTYFKVKMLTFPFFN